MCDAGLLEEGPHLPLPLFSLCGNRSPGLPAHISGSIWLCLQLLFLLWTHGVLAGSGLAHLGCFSVSASRLPVGHPGVELPSLSGPQHFPLCPSCNSPRPYLAHVLHTHVTPIQVTSPGPSSCPSISTSAPAQPMSPPHLPHDPCPHPAHVPGFANWAEQGGVRGDHGRFQS